MTPLALAARGYLAAGFQIIALSGKQPNTAIHPHGLNNALSGVPEDADDDELIERVFTHPQTTGIGLVIVFPYMVVDVDGEEGAVALQSILGTHEIDQTPVARTGRGLHIWFSDWQPRRSARLGTKLDLKGIGGYVAAPPSRHPDGHLYEWLDPIIDEESGQARPVMEVPDAIREHLDRLDRMAEDFAVERPPRVGRLVVSDTNVWKMVMEPASIEGLVKYVGTLPAGNRNAGLHWASCAAREDGFPLAEALSAFVPAAIEVGLSAQEARTAIRSAFRSKM